MRKSFIVTSALLFLPLLIQPVFAEQKSSDVLQRVPLNRYQLGLQKAVLAPNQEKPLHMHIGPEAAYVLEGEITVISWCGTAYTCENGGNEEVVKVYKAGESFQHLAYVPHITRAGSEGAVVLASWVTEEGKQFTVPLP